MLALWAFALRTRNVPKTNTLALAKLGIANKGKPCDENPIFRFAGTFSQVIILLRFAIFSGRLHGIGTRNEEQKPVVSADGDYINDAVQGWSPVMRQTDYRTLINRGRKAGLKTTDLYSALTARRPEIGDQLDGQTDGNGFVRAFDRQGQSVYRPAGSQ